MFSFSKDALDAIGQGSVKKSKMALETTEVVSPQSNLEDAQKSFELAAAATEAAYKLAASVDEVAPNANDDIFIVPNALCVPLAIKYAAKDSARVLIVESSEARVHSTVSMIREQSSSLSVATGLPFAFTGPSKVTVTSAIVVAGLLSKRKNLFPFSHVIVNNVTSFTIGVQVFLGQLKRLINNVGAKGHHRVLLCGDVKIALDIVTPIFNKLKIGSMKTSDSSVVSIDTVAAFTKKQLVKIPTANCKAPFAPYTSFAIEQAKEILAWAKTSVKAEGAVAVLGHEGVVLAGAALPIVSIVDATTAKGLFAVIATNAESLLSVGIRPLIVIDLGVATVRNSNSPAEALLQNPRVEFASAVEIAQRQALAGNRPYFALYPAAAPRPLRSFDAILSTEDKNELLQATRNGLDLRAFVAPIRDSALDEALTTFAELGLVQSKAEPIQTFLGEIVSRLSNLTVEMGVFVAIATALGMADIASVVASVNAVGGLYTSVEQMTSLRSKYDPDDSNSSDVLADAVVFLTEAEHSKLCASKISAASELQHSILRTLANYQPPCEKRCSSEQRAALTKNASLLAFLLTAAYSTNACKIANSQGELLNIRSVERVKGPAAGSVVAFPTRGAIVTATTLRKDTQDSISYSGVTMVCTSHFNAAQVIFRPVVQHSSTADTNTEGDSIVRFAISSNGFANNYHVPLEAANRIIEARAALCTALGLMMLRRLTTPHATSTEEFVMAVRRKRRDFNFVKHVEETVRMLESAVQESAVQYVITTFVKKQMSVLAPVEAGILEESAPRAVATDLYSLEGFFEKSLKKDSADQKDSGAKAVSGEGDVQPAVGASDTVGADDDEDDDYFAKNGPIMDDDDE